MNGRLLFFAKDAPTIYERIRRSVYGRSGSINKWEDGYWSGHFFQYRNFRFQ